MSGDTDLALRITVPRGWAEVVGALLMDRLGPFAEEPSEVDPVTLVFYPQEGDSVSEADIGVLLPAEVVEAFDFRIERQAVGRDWVEGWKDHFHPLVIGRVRVRPPWEPPADGTEDLIDVVINPGLGFGTGLHPTTRGTLTLLQDGTELPGSRGALVDAGTGSGVLSIAAAKLGWGPIVAFDNDPAALEAARENIAENGAAGLVEVRECAVEEALPDWFEGATVLANMTLLPVLALLRRLDGIVVERLVVSGILSGAQEERLLQEAGSLGFVPGRSIYETEWVSLELLAGDSREGG